ncbi:MAG: AMP-binding protein, partial [Desulfobulbaceae bacterium]
GNSLRHLSTGGETLVPLDPPSRYGFHNLYGPTEGTIITTAFPVDRLYDRVPIGKPVDNTRIYVLDRYNHLAPVGVPGELCIAGRGVAKGYLGRPELSREKFIPNPLTDEEDYNRLYRTGDLVRYLPDGNIDFVGRDDFQVKIRGFRVELPEIESRIRAFPGIKDASVLPMDAPGGGKCAVAYVVMEGTLDLPALNRFIEEKLPPYMVPAATLQVDRIPLNPNGKVDRRKLPAPTFAEQSTEEPAGYLQTDLGKEIAQVLEEVLGYGHFAPSSNLLQAGLASLGAIKLCSLLKKRFGAAPPVQELLANPSPLFIENTIIHDLLEGGAERPEPATRDAGPAQLGYPLSGSQMGVYLDCQKDPQALSYNIPSRLTLPPEADPDKLAAAIETVLDGHPGIRIRIEETADGIRQVPLEEPVRVNRLKLTDGEVEAFAETFAQPFQLATGPLYRVTLVESPDALLVFSDFHHLAFDGASMDLFLRELGQVYEGGKPVPEEMAGHAYGQWEVQEEAKGAWEGHRAYFATLLKDIEGASELAADLPGKTEGRLARAECPVDRQAAEVFCGEHGLTLAGLFLASTSYCLGRWTGSPSVSLSTISSGRNDIRLMNSFGMFVRTLPLVIRMDQDQSVLDYIREAQAALHASVSHEAYPYTLIAQEHGFSPHIMYAYELGVLSDYRIAGHPARVEELATEAPKFKISIHVEERGSDTVFSVQYNDALYSAPMMNRLAESLAVSFSQMLAQPQAKVKNVSLLSDKEAALIESFQPKNPPPLPCPLLHGMFEQAADRSPETTALMASEGQYSYAQLDAEANRIANALLGLGLVPEDRVAFLLPRTGRILMTMLGILKAGGAYVPLDLDYPDERIRQILDDSQARFLITTQDRRADNPIALDVEDLRAHPDAGRPDRTVEPDQLAYIIYTSGSTGKPKGVMIEHHGIANYLTPAPENLHIHALVEDASCMMSITTVTFDMFLKESMAALCNGLKLVFADAEAARDPLRLADLFEETGADAFNATPSRMMEYISYPALLSVIRRCRVVMAGAEKYPDQLMERLREGEGQAPRLFNTYGPTEITVSSNGKELTTADRVTIGGPLLGVVESVMDPDGNELPTGVVGELWIGGRGVARGYVNLPDQTRESFVVHKGIRM